jgi:bacterioferritin-associated ferredoxin
MGVDIAVLRIKRVIGNGEECFLCSLENEIESKYTDTYLSELVMDASSREKIIESRGFCNHHFYKTLIAANKPGSPDGHGIALINESIVDKLIQDLINKKSHHIDALHKLLATENKCPACIHLAEFSRMYEEKIVELLSSDSEEFLRLLKESKGFCIPHFVTLVQVAKDVAPTQSQKIVKTLMEIEEKNLRRLNSELAEYVKRQSYEFSEKDLSAVADVIPRSVKKIAGRRGIKLVTVERMQR